MREIVLDYQGIRPNEGYLIPSPRKNGEREPYLDLKTKH
jgi:hypothetical protein